MATVTGMTAEKIEEIVDDSIVSVSIDSETGVLTVQTRGGQTVTAGNVDLAATAIERAYPVGSIFMSTIATNPASQLGMGTWAAWGKGRVPVGVDTDQTEFADTEKTGGEKTHLLTTAEMPSHAHSNPPHSHDMGHDHAPFNTGTGGSHDHTTQYNDVDGTSVNTIRTATSTNLSTDDTNMIMTSGAHAHAIDVPRFDGNTLPAGGGTDATGGGSAHNNLQPYITCYMWKRTA